MNTILLSLIEVMSQLPQPAERAQGVLHDLLLPLLVPQRAGQLVEFAQRVAQHAPQFKSTAQESGH